MGAYHTLDLEMNREFTLFKNFWDIVALVCALIWLVIIEGTD